MSADTLTPGGAAVTLTAPAAGAFSDSATSYQQVSWAALSGQDEVVVASLGIDSAGNSRSAVMSAYSLNGTLLFQSLMNNPPLFEGLGSINIEGSPSVAAVGLAGEFAFSWNSYSRAQNDPNSNPTHSGQSELIFYHANGAAIMGSGGEGLPPELFAASFGLHVESGTTNPPTMYSDDYSPAFTPIGHTATPGLFMPAYADVLIGGDEFTVNDNQAGMAGGASTTLPGEPVHSVTDVAAAGLADGTRAAVAFADSGTDYVAIYDKTTNSFSDRIGLDWGGAGDLHVVALPDGGFAVSWDNGGAYKGELFDGAGNGRGIIGLTGQFAAIDSHGDLYTVGLDSSGAEAVQTYAINGSGGGGGTGGQAFDSDNNGDVWTGTAGNDTFNLGRGGDYVTGAGGADTFKFAEIPWAGGHITDFNQGDVLDLSGLIATTQDIPAGGFSDGYLQLTDDGVGDTQVWARYATSGSDSNWWLVTTLDGVKISNLDAHHTFVTFAPNAGGGPTDVSTSDASYTAPASVKTITLTGSQQHIDASATSGVTINSNDSGNVVTGGAGDDAFHLGRGGDWAAGGAGADTFAYAGTPWAGGGITDFSAAQGDRIDVSGLLQASGYTGSDPFADGFLKLTTDSSGNAQLWSDVHQPGNDGWWLVATLDGVSTSSLHYSGGLIT